MGGWEGRWRVGDEVENNNDFEDFHIINTDRYIIYIRKPKNFVVDHNSKAILISYVSNDDILG